MNNYLIRCSFRHHKCKKLQYCHNCNSNYLHQGGYVIIIVRLLSTVHKNFQTDLHESFRDGWQWASEQIVKFWRQSGSLSGYRDCFPDSSLLGDTESG